MKYKTRLKYDVGDVLFVKQYKYNHRIHLLCRHPILRLRLPHNVIIENTLGIITAVVKHSELFQSGSTETDNCYVWLSQNYRKQYNFFESEVECEVVK